MNNQIGFEVSIPDSHHGAIERVTEVLKVHGFGILTSIDVRNTFQEKLGIEFRPYAILGACNPQLAHRALSARPEVGLLLPCNVTVEAHPSGGATVRIVDPMAMFEAGGFGHDDEIDAVVDEARRLLRNVAAELAAEA